MALPVKKVTAVQAVVESLKERIRNGEFGPRARLPSETVLLEEYEVSRLTLREAIARLAALGIIRVRHGKGAYVSDTISISALDDVLTPLFPQYDASRMNELVEARTLIESEIAGKIAESRTDEQIEYLNHQLDCSSEILNDPDLFAEQDYNFHFALVRLSENQFFIAMYQALYSQIRTFLTQYAKSIEDRKAAMEKHRPILEAIADQNVERARGLAREHAGMCASFVKNRY